MKKRRAESCRCLCAFFVRRFTSRLLFYSFGRDEAYSWLSHLNDKHFTLIVHSVMNLLLLCAFNWSYSSHSPLFSTINFCAFGTLCCILCLLILQCIAWRKREGKIYHPCALNFTILYPVLPAVMHFGFSISIR